MKTVHVQPLNAWELGWLVPCSLFSTNVGPRRLHYAFATTYRSRVWSCLLVQVEWWTQNEHVVSSARRMRVNNGDGHHISSMLDCFENLHTGSTKSSTGGETAKHLLLPNPNRRHGRHMENHRPSLLRAHVPVTETLVIHRLSIASRRRRSPRAAAMEWKSTLLPPDSTSSSSPLSSWLPGAAGSMCTSWAGVTCVDADYGRVTGVALPRSRRSRVSTPTTNSPITVQHVQWQ